MQITCSNPGRRSLTHLNAAEFLVFYFVQVVRPAAASRSVNQHSISRTRWQHEPQHPLRTLFYVFISNNKARTGEKPERRVFRPSRRENEKTTLRESFLKTFYYHQTTGHSRGSPLFDTRFVPVSQLFGDDDALQQ